MKEPADYVAQAWETAGPLAASQNVLATATEAVRLALLDAALEKQKYANLLLRAVQNSKPKPQPTPEAPE